LSKILLEKKYWYIPGYFEVGVILRQSATIVFCGPDPRTTFPEIWALAYPWKPIRETWWHQHRHMRKMTITFLIEKNGN